jgi:hypothetical protein
MFAKFNTNTAIKILTAILFLFTFGLLVSQRFSMRQELTPLISDTKNQTGYQVGNELRRGETVSTSNGFLQIVFVDDTNAVLSELWLAQNTSVSLERIFKNKLLIKLIRGRIVLESDAFPIEVKTNETLHTINGAIASLVNYDFLENVHVAPISGTVRTYISQTNEYLMVVSPLSIHEIYPFERSNVDFNFNAGDAKNFYDWTGALTYSSAIE